MITEEGDVEDQVQELELGKAIKIEKFLLLPLVTMNESAYALYMSLVTTLLYFSFKRHCGRSVNNLNYDDCRKKRILIMTTLYISQPSHPINWAEVSMALMRFERA